MARLIRHYGVGAVSADFSVASMVDLLRSLTSEQINAMRANAVVAARDLCWERESEALARCLDRA